MTTVDPSMVRASAPSAPSFRLVPASAGAAPGTRPPGAALAMPVLATGLAASLALYAALGVLLVMALARAAA